MSGKSTRYFLLGFVSAIVAERILRYFLTTQDNRNKNHGRPLIITYGDSITQKGFDGWVGLLADWYSRRVDVLNRGFSGYQTRWALNMFNEVVIQNKPDLLFIFFGANDAVVEGVLQHVPLAEYKENLNQMILLIKKNLPMTQIVLITPPPVYEPDLQLSNSAKGKPILSDRTNDRTLQYVLTCLALGKQYQIPVVDAWKGLGGDDPTRQQYLSDGLHLSTDGNRKLFEIIQRTILTELGNWIPDNLPFHMKPWNEMK